MHIPPEIWGPMFWATFHIVSLGYPDAPTYADKRAAKEFFTALPYLLPCAICREHFAEVLKGQPIESWLDNRKSLVNWVFTVHNMVNERLGKPAITMDEFYKRYREMSERGLPIPPANPTAELSDVLLQQQYVRGATHAAVGIAAATCVGALLWYSYKGKS
jgi:hypothetical protein